MADRINTFSSAVRDVQKRTQRPDLLSNGTIKSYVRKTIDECHSMAKFRRDLIEDSITSDNQSAPFTWTYPSNFRILRAVKYPIYDHRGEAVYPEEIKPGPKQKDKDYFYYSAKNYYIFAGIAETSTIDVAYYVKSIAYAYYTEENEPAYFDAEDQQWHYLTASTPEEEQAAQDLVTNWLLTEYYETIVEGAVAKTFKTIDDPRARSSFALYKSYQNDIKAVEPSDDSQL